MSGKTIAEWCRDYNVSRSTFYNLKRLNKAPRLLMLNGGFRITPEADAEWRRDREADAVRRSAMIQHGTEIKS